MRSASVLLTNLVFITTSMAYCQQFASLWFLLPFTLEVRYSNAVRGQNGETQGESLVIGVNSMKRHAAHAETAKANSSEMMLKAWYRKDYRVGAEGCEKDISGKYCCGSKKGSGCDDGERSPCKNKDEDSGMKCNFVFFKGYKCQCGANMCYDVRTGTCVKPEFLLVDVGGTSPAKPEKKRVEIKVEDPIPKMLEPADGKSLQEECDETQNNHSVFQEMGDSVSEVGHVVERTAVKVVKTGGSTVLSTIRTALSPVINSLASGATRFTGWAAGRLMNMKNDNVEKYLQWALANFVLTDDECQNWGPADFVGDCPSCDRGTGPANIFATKPNYGHCHFDLSEVPDADTPIYDGPLYPYDNGKEGINQRKFNISLSAKVGQIRCLEALQVQKSHCYGNLLAEGGFCDLELSPDKDCPLAVKDVEIMIYCQGHCDVSQHAMSLLNDDRSLEIGDEVYIKKVIDEPTTWDWLIHGESTRHAKRGDIEFKGCSSGDDAKGTIVRNIVRCTGPDNPSCMRHCIESVDGTNFGCWAAKNIIRVADCGLGARAARWAIWATTGTTQQDSQKESKRILLYRKFDIILEHVNIRTRLFVHRTRSLQEVVNEEQTEEKQEETSGMFESFFSRVTKTVSKVGRIIRHPREWLLTDQELVKQYKINVKEVRDPKDGSVDGYELVECDQPIWNDKTEEYDQPPLEKCFKIYLQDLQLLATRPDYLKLEETSSFVEPPSGVRHVLSDMLGFYSRSLTASLGYENVGFILGVMTKLVRMMFVRDVVLLKAKDLQSGEFRYCVDKWVEKSDAEDSYAVGVKCGAENTTENANDDGSGIGARFEFEVVELPPVWNEARKRNDIEIGIRGGYNQQFCRVAETEEERSGSHVGQVICDVDPPVQEYTQMVEPEQLPPAARFQIQHLGKNDVASKVVIGSTSGEAPDAPQCSSPEGGEDYDCNDIEDAAESEKSGEEWSDDTDVRPDDNLVVRLKFAHAGKFCTVMDVPYKIHHVFTTEKPMLICDSSTGDGHDLQLEGNIDTLTPSAIWDRLIMIIITCMGAGLGWAQGKWGAFFGGAGGFYMFTSVVGGTITGALFGMMATEILAAEFHLDGMMLRYLAKTKLQGIGQYVLFCVESALVFEFPRP